MFETFKFKTGPGTEMVNVSAQVQAIVARSGVQEGICVVVLPHTTGGLTVNSYLDPLTPADLVTESDRIVPTRINFHHQADGPTDASGHIKASLFGNSQSFIVTGGKLLLGHSQAIFFCEFDGPRDRQVHVRVMRDT